MKSSIKVEKGLNETIIIKFSYNPEYIKKIKFINGYRWHPEEKIHALRLHKCCASCKETVE